MSTNISSVIGIFFLIPAVILIAILFKLRKMIKKTKIVDYHDFRIAEFYRCPRCSCEMKRGYVVASRGIIWRQAQDEPIGIFSTIDKSLENTINFTARPLENRAWKCDSCKYIMIDYNALMGKTTKQKKPL